MRSALLPKQKHGHSAAWCRAANLLIRSSSLANGKRRLGTVFFFFSFSLCALYLLSSSSSSSSQKALGSCHVHVESRFSMQRAVLPWAQVSSLLDTRHSGFTALRGRTCLLAIRPKSNLGSLVSLGSVSCSSTKCHRDHG